MNRQVNLGPCVGAAQGSKQQDEEGFAHQGIMKGSLMAPVGTGEFAGSVMYG
jgi:hypothetical protein